MINDDTMELVTEALTDARDAFVLAQYVAKHDAVNRVKIGIESLRDVADALGYVLVMKDDGK